MSVSRYFVNRVTLDVLTLGQGYCESYHEREKVFINEISKSIVPYSSQRNDVDLRKLVSITVMQILLISLFCPIIQTYITIKIFP